MIFWYNKIDSVPALVSVVSVTVVACSYLKLTGCIYNKTGP